MSDFPNENSELYSEDEEVKKYYNEFFKQEAKEKEASALKSNNPDKGSDFYINIPDNKIHHINFFDLDEETIPLKINPRINLKDFVFQVCISMKEVFEGDIVQFGNAIYFSFAADNNFKMVISSNK